MEHLMKSYFDQDVKFFFRKVYCLINEKVKETLFLFKVCIKFIFAH